MKIVYKFLKILPIILLGLNCSVFATSVTFSYTGGVQTYTVPTGVYSVSVQAYGAQGANPTDVLPTSHMGGWGALAAGNLAVVPGQVLFVYVGQAGLTTGAGSYNGGGAPGLSSAGSGCSGGYAGGGGGASDVRTAGTTLAARVIVGAGGGGAGRDYCNGTCVPCGCGGSGGPNDMNGHYAFNCGYAYPGTGVNYGSKGVLTLTVNAGPNDGGGGTFSTSGTLGVGGNGAPGSYDVAGGGGGGGYYGGGGGGAASSGSGVGGGGGGGGSSYVGTMTSTTIIDSAHSGNGTVVISVNCTPPIAGAIVDPSPVCVSTNTTLTNPTGSTGGAWTTTDATIATIGSASGVITGVSAGTVLISYSIILSCGTAFASSVITVNPLPGPVSGLTDLCTGTTSLLTDSTSGGTWTSSTTSVATIGSVSGLVSGLGVGTSILVYTLPTGCQTTLTVSIAGITGASDLCVGSSTTLTSSSTTGSWSSSNTSVATVGSTGIVNGVSMGLVVISYNLPIGCTALHSMTINPIAPIAGHDSVCLGSTGYLTDIVGGGTWNSQYPGVASISIDSGLVYGFAAGITSITYTLATGCTAYVNMSVINYPPAITGGTQMCPGGTTTLTNSLSGGVWSSANNYVATVSPAGTVTGVFADTTTIYYTILPNCAVGIQVLVNPDPAPLSGKSIICPGVTDTMTDPTPGGVWSSVTPTLGTINQAGVVTTLAGGIATIKYTLPLTGCYSTTTISIYPAPAPVITYVQADGTLYCDTPWVSYQWYDSIQGKIVGATSPTLAALNSEYYYVVVTDTNGCKAASAFFHFDSSVLGVNSAASSRIRIYPNPSDGLVYISAPVKVRAVVTGIDGRKELDQANAKVLDLGKLPDGVYLIALYDNNGQIITIQKLTKQ